MSLRARPYFLIVVACASLAPAQVRSAQIGKALGRVTELTDRIDAGEGDAALRLERADLLLALGHAALARDDVLATLSPASLASMPSEQRRAREESLARCQFDLGSYQTVLRRLDAMPDGVASASHLALASRAALLSGDPERARDLAAKSGDAEAARLSSVELRLHAPHDGGPLRSHVAPDAKPYVFTMPDVAPRPSGVSEDLAARRILDLQRSAPSDPVDRALADTDWIWREPLPQAIGVPASMSTGMRQEELDTTDGERAGSSWLLEPGGDLSFAVAGPTILSLRLRAFLDPESAAGGVACDLVDLDGGERVGTLLVSQDRPAPDRVAKDLSGFLPGAGRTFDVPVPLGLHHVGLRATRGSAFVGATYLAPRAETFFASGEPPLEALTLLASTHPDAAMRQRALGIVSQPRRLLDPAAFPEGSEMRLLTEIAALGLGDEPNGRTRSIVLCMERLARDEDDPSLRDVIARLAPLVKWTKVAGLSGDVGFERVRDDVAPPTSLSQELRRALCPKALRDTLPLEASFAGPLEVELSLPEPTRLGLDATHVTLMPQGLPSAPVPLIVSVDGGPGRELSLTTRELAHLDLGSQAAGAHVVTLTLVDPVGRGAALLGLRGVKGSGAGERSAIVEYASLAPGAAMEASIQGPTMVRVDARALASGSVVEVLEGDRKATLRPVAAGPPTPIEERVGVSALAKETFELVVPGSGTRTLRLVAQGPAPVLLRLFTLGDRQPVVATEAAQVAWREALYEAPPSQHLDVFARDPIPRLGRDFGGVATQLRYGRNVDPDEVVESNHFGADYLQSDVLFRRRLNALPLYLRFRAGERDLLPSGALVARFGVRASYRKERGPRASVGFGTATQRLDTKLRTALATSLRASWGLPVGRWLSVTPEVGYDLRKQPLDTLESFRRDQVDVDVFFPYKHDHARSLMADVKAEWAPFSDLSLYVTPQVYGNNDASLDHLVVETGGAGFYRGLAASLAILRYDWRADDHRLNGLPETRYRARLRYSFFSSQALRWSIDVDALRLPHVHQTDFFVGIGVRFDWGRLGRDEDPGERLWIRQEESRDPEKSELRFIPEETR